MVHFAVLLLKGFWSLPTDRAVDSSEASIYTKSSLIWSINEVYSSGLHLNDQCKRANAPLSSATRIVGFSELSNPLRKTWMVAPSNLMSASDYVLLSCKLL